MMMMIQQQQQQQQQQRHPTVEIPQMYEDPTAGGPLTPAAFSPQTCNYLTALSRYLPSSSPEEEEEAAEYSCDEFRMYEFKVRRCPRGRSHDWTDCPYAHPGEKARRRDPRRHRYSGSSCPDFRRGCCRRGDACDLAHGVFESWLHPSRYRTQPCKDGPHCQRRVCFFAHSPEQLRVVGPDALSLSLSLSSDASLSPPMSPPQRRVCFPLSSPPSSPTVDDLAAAMRGLKVGPRRAGPGFGSPRTPTARPGLGALDTWWEGGEGEEGAPVMERVESGRGIRERMYQRLSRENSLLERDSDRADPAGPGGPDFGWVSELVK